jgi:hypothetical protein
MAIIQLKITIFQLVRGCQFHREVELDLRFSMVGGSLWPSLTTKTGRHDIAEILLKVVLNTKN